jgi:hypothetical protein
MERVGAWSLACHGERPRLKWPGHDPTRHDSAGGAASASSWDEASDSHVYLAGEDDTMVQAGG